MSNPRFQSQYFRVNALLTRKITTEGESQTESLYTEIKFQTSRRNFSNPCSLRVATLVAVALYRVYPEYDLKAILFTNIPRDDTLRRLYLRPYLYDRFYTVLGRSFDLDSGDTLYIRFRIPEINGVRYYTFMIIKEETDFLPVLLNNDRFRIPDLLASRISQLHISTSRLNQFGGWDPRGDFPRTRYQRG